ncbi:putative reductase [Entophlyctis helioformis]|nr:putative reductase [Entophlyctis helioformis]
MIAPSLHDRPTVFCSREVAFLFPPHLSTMTSIKLNSGYSIPTVGLGVWQAEKEETVPAILWALEAGYRHIDTAALYKNEEEVGEAIRKSGIPRDQIFVTTKLWNDDQGYEQALAGFDVSLKKLGLDYIDLYLLHAPLPGKRADSWRALEKLHKEGKIRSIGVSNYGVHHLKEMESYATITPAVNQIEITPYLQRREIVDYCKSKGIVIQAYSPLTQGQKLNDPPLVGVAAKYGKSTAQILIRWGIEKGFVTLPKSVKKDRLAANIDVFDFKITPGDMAVLDGLEAALVVGWDPTVWE